LGGKKSYRLQGDRPGSPCGGKKKKGRAGERCHPKEMIGKRKKKMTRGNPGKGRGDLKNSFLGGKPWDREKKKKKKSLTNNKDSKK